VVPRELRIAYVVPEFVRHESGVGAKVRQQASAWRGRGCDVATFVARSDEPWHGEARIAVVEPVPPTGVRGWIDRERSLRRVVTDVSAFAPDVVYLRYGPYARSLGRLLRGHRAVIEVNSDDVEEYRLANPLLRAYNRSTRGFMFRPAAGIVFPSGELARRRRFAKFSRPSTVVSNGIELAAFPASPPPHNARPRLVFSASTSQPWHGVDKVLRLAELVPDVDIDVVGSVSVSDSELPANVRVHGYLTGPRYRAVIDAADVGLGTLALHRIGMAEASPLKVREYLATGLPCVIAYQDTDFPDAVDFLLVLPNGACNVDENAEVIRGFAQSWHGRRVPRERVPHIDRAVKERDRLDFLLSLSRSGSSDGAIS
jgi:hypothetical protein